MNSVGSVCTNGHGGTFVRSALDAKSGNTNKPGVSWGERCGVGDGERKKKVRP
jgi:hypothetical protein